MLNYSPTLIDHMTSPRNAGRLENPTNIGYVDRDGLAPRIAIYLRLRGDVIEGVGFETVGCGIAIASCSQLTEMINHKSVEAALALRPQQILTALGDVPRGKEFCAWLAIAALNNALSSY